MITIDLVCKITEVIVGIGMTILLYWFATNLVHTPEPEDEK